MDCPHCCYPGMRVIKSRPDADGHTIRRRRECTSCKKRITTLERIKPPRIKRASNA